MRVGADQRKKLALRRLQGFPPPEPPLAPGDHDASVPTIRFPPIAIASSRPNSSGSHPQQPQSAPRGGRAAADDDDDNDDDDDYGYANDATDGADNDNDGNGGDDEVEAALRLRQLLRRHAGSKAHLSPAKSSTVIL